MIGLHGIIGAFVNSLFPGLWAILYQAPIGFIVAYIVVMQQAARRVEGKTIVTLAAICGLGGAGVFFILGLIPVLLTVLVALAVMWVGISLALDRYLDIDSETSQRITAMICVPVWLLWIIIGAVIYVLRVST